MEVSNVPKKWIFNFSRFFHPQNFVLGPIFHFSRFFFFPKKIVLGPVCLVPKTGIWPATHMGALSCLEYWILEKFSTFSLLCFQLLILFDILWEALEVDFCLVTIDVWSSKCSLSRFWCSIISQNCIILRHIAPNDHNPVHMQFVRRPIFVIFSLQIQQVRFWAVTPTLVQYQDEQKPTTL